MREQKGGMNKPESMRKFVFHSTSESVARLPKIFVHDFLDFPIGKTFIISGDIYLFEALLENASRLSTETAKYFMVKDYAVLRNKVDKLELRRKTASSEKYSLITE